MTTLATISTFFVILPLMVGLTYYKRLPRAAKFITWLLITWFITESIAHILARKGIPNWNVYMLLSFAEIAIVTMFYKQVFVSRKAKSVIVWIAWVGLGLVSAEYIISDGPDNTFTMFFECTFFFGMGLYAFYEMVVHKLSWNYNLLVIGVMALFLGSAIYFSTWKFMKYDEGLFRLFVHTHAFLLIGCYSVFTFSLWRLRL